ncbi:MAG: TAXI family TRAP transporter solute-binding subunit [Beijerinckiaceae bacterium]
MNVGQRRLLVFVGLVLALVGLGFGYRIATRPVVLSLAVGPAGQEDELFASALARALAGSSLRDRIAVKPTSGPAESLDLLRDGKVDLAIVRQDSQIPQSARALAVLHADPVVVLAHKAAGVANVRDLAGKTIGLLGTSAGNAQLMDTLRKHYRGRFTTVDLPLSATAVADALAQKRADAVLFVAPTTKGSAFSEAWQTVRKATKKSLDFLPIDDAAAIVAAAPAYEEGEIAAGQFGGSPPLPSAAVDTILVTTHLVARQSVSETAITELTKFIFENRAKLVADAPVAALVKAASTDKDSTIPVHSGAKIYFEGEEQTLMERYGDWLWIGPMLIGGIASALLGLWRFLQGGGESEYEDLLESITDTINAIKTAKTDAELDSIREKIDAAIERISRDVMQGATEDSRIGSVSVVIAYVDRLLREKRLSMRQG